MSTSNFKSFAILGVGTIGIHFLDAFLAAGISPLVLTRKSSNKTFPPSVRVAKVDLENVDEIAKVLKENNVEVIVSAIGTTAIPAQYPVADAAKEAGVKLFVPSEYGCPTDGISGYPGEHESSPLAQKDKFAQYLKSIGLPYTRVASGAFFDYIPWLTGLAENGKINIAGKGNEPVSFTDVSDLAGYLVHILTTLPPSELENKSLRIEGDSATLLDIAKRWKKDVQYVEQVPGEPTWVINYFSGLIEGGRASVSWDYALNGRRQGESANDNGLWSGHKWKTLDDSQLGL
ncbi:hypothetical protein V5O48_002068 [Marasmius crinis-equi]|uniref:NmrA-like domain-containing protein n=1 Tax=Marasmius crinis-equi TaxID=585013 RepID=A0ABR3FWM3_9AGAR